MAGPGRTCPDPGRAGCCAPWHAGARRGLAGAAIGDGRQDRSAGGKGGKPHPRPHGARQVRWFRRALFPCAMRGRADPGSAPPSARHRVHEALPGPPKTSSIFWLPPSPAAAEPRPVDCPTSVQVPGAPCHARLAGVPQECGLALSAVPAIRRRGVPVGTRVDRRPQQQHLGVQGPAQLLCLPPEKPAPVAGKSRAATVEPDQFDGSRGQREIERRPAWDQSAGNGGSDGAEWGGWHCHRDLRPAAAEILPMMLLPDPRRPFVGLRSGRRRAFRQTQRAVTGQ